MEDGLTRLSGADFVSVSTDDAPEGEVVGINADTLGGYAADAYVKKTDAMIVTKNYSVVGGIDKPTIPTKNMIWVQTENAIGKVHFSGVEPSSVNDNDIWIYTGDGSNVAFDAIKIGNDTMNTVYPLSAKQYVSGAWVDVEAKSYQNGEWVEWFPKGALYWDGDYRTSITGGWISEAKRYQSSSSVTAKAPVVTRHDDHVYLTQIGAGSGVFYTANKVDLTGYTKLVAEGEFYATGSSAQNWELCVWSEIGTYYGQNQVSSVYAPLKQKVTKLEIDVSNINGVYHVGFVMNSIGASSSEVGYNKIVRCYLE